MKSLTRVAFWMVLLVVWGGGMSVSVSGESATVVDFLETQQRVQKVLSHAMETTVGVGDGGSGVIVSEDGLVLTAAHVSGSPGRNISCRLSNGEVVRARTLGNFEYADAGMVQLLEDGPWPFSPMGARRTIHAGDWCFALGHPGGYDEDRGLVLRVGKVIYTRSDLLRSDCELLRGDSGGPLFNLKGEVIGIHSRIGEPFDDNYHSPIDAFHKMWEPLLAGEELPNSRPRGNRGYLGVVTEPHDQGVIVVQVREDTTADSAGFKVDDIILKIDGYAVEDTSELRWVIGKNAPGESIRIEYLRDGQRAEKTVELGTITSRRRGSS